MFCGHELPLVRIAILKGEPFRVRTVTQDDRVLSIRNRPENIGAQNEASSISIGTSQSSGMPSRVSDRCCIAHSGLAYGIWLIAYGSYVPTISHKLSAICDFGAPRI